MEEGLRDEPDDKPGTNLQRGGEWGARVCVIACAELRVFVCVSSVRTYPDWLGGGGGGRWTT